MHEFHILKEIQENPYCFGIGAYPAVAKDTPLTCVLKPYSIYARADQNRIKSILEMHSIIHPSFKSEEEEDNSEEDEEDKDDNEEFKHFKLVSNGVNTENAGNSISSDTILMNKVIYPIIFAKLKTQSPEFLEIVKGVTDVKGSEYKHIVIMQQIIDKSFDHPNLQDFIPTFFQELIKSHDKISMLLFLNKYIKTKSKIPLEFALPKTLILWDPVPKQDCISTQAYLAENNCLDFAYNHYYLSGEHGIFKFSRPSSQLVCFNAEYTDVTDMCAIKNGLIIVRKSQASLMLLSFQELKLILTINIQIDGRIYGYDDKVFIDAGQNGEPVIVEFAKDNSYKIRKEISQPEKNLFYYPVDQIELPKEYFNQRFFFCRDPGGTQLLLVTSDINVLNLGFSPGVLDPNLMTSSGVVNFVERILTSMLYFDEDWVIQNPTDYCSILIDFFLDLLQIPEYETVIPIVFSLLINAADKAPDLLEKLVPKFEFLEEKWPYFASTLATKGKSLMKISKYCINYDKTDKKYEMMKNDTKLLFELAELKNDLDLTAAIEFAKRLFDDNFAFREANRSDLIQFFKIRPKCPYNYLEFVAQIIPKLYSCYVVEIYEAIMDNLEFVKPYEDQIYNFAANNLSDYLATNCLTVISQSYKLTPPSPNGIYYWSRLDEEPITISTSFISNNVAIQGITAQKGSIEGSLFAAESPNGFEFVYKISRNEALTEYEKYHRLEDVILDSIFVKLFLKSQIRKQDFMRKFNILMSKNYFNSSLFDLFHMIDHNFRHGFIDTQKIILDKFFTYEAPLLAFEVLNYNISRDDKYEGALDQLNIIIHADFPNHTITQFQSFLDVYISKVHKFAITDEFASNLINEYFNLQYQPSNQIGSLAQLILATLTVYNWNIPNKDDVISNIALKTLDLDIPPLIISLRTIVENTESKWTLGPKILHACETLGVAYGLDQHQNSSKMHYDRSHRYAHQIARVLYLLTCHNFDEILNNSAISELSKQLILSTGSIPALVGDKFKIGGAIVKLVAISPEFMVYEYNGATFSVPTQNFVHGMDDNLFEKVPLPELKTSVKSIEDLKMNSNLVLDILNVTGIKSNNVPEYTNAKILTISDLFSQTQNFIKIDSKFLDINDVCLQSDQNLFLYPCLLDNIYINGSSEKFVGKVSLGVCTDTLSVRFIANNAILPIRALVTKNEIIVQQAAPSALVVCPMRTDGKVYFVVKSDLTSIDASTVKTGTVNEKYLMGKTPDWQNIVGSKNFINTFYREGLFSAFKSDFFLPYVNIKDHNSMRIDFKTDVMASIYLLSDLSITVEYFKIKVHPGGFSLYVIKQNNVPFVFFSGENETNYPEDSFSALLSVDEFIIAYKLKDSGSISIQDVYYDVDIQMEGKDFIGEYLAKLSVPKNTDFIMEAHEEYRNNWKYRIRCGDFSYGVEYPAHTSVNDAPVGLQFMSGTMTKGIMTVTNTTSMTNVSFPVHLNSSSSIIDCFHFYNYFQEHYVKDRYSMSAYARPEYRRVSPAFPTTFSEMITYNIITQLNNDINMRLIANNMELPEGNDFIPKMIDIIVDSVENEMFEVKTDYRFSEFLNKKFADKELSKSVIDFCVKSLITDIAERVKAEPWDAVPYKIDFLKSEADGFFALFAQISIMDKVYDNCTEAFNFYPDNLYTVRTNSVISDNLEDKIIGIAKIIPFSFRNGYGRNMRAAICFLNHLCKVQPEMVINDFIIPLLKSEYVAFPLNLQHWMIATFELVDPEILRVYRPFFNRKHSSELYSPALAVILLRLSCLDINFAKIAASKFMKYDPNFSMCILFVCTSAMVMSENYRKYGIDKLPDSFLKIFDKIMHSSKSNMERYFVTQNHVNGNYVQYIKPFSSKPVKKPLIHYKEVFQDSKLLSPPIIINVNNVMKYSMFPIFGDCQKFVLPERLCVKQPKAIIYDINMPVPMSDLLIQVQQIIDCGGMIDLKAFWKMFYDKKHNWTHKNNDMFAVRNDFSPLWWQYKMELSQHHIQAWIALGCIIAKTYLFDNHFIPPIDPKLLFSVTYHLDLDDEIIRAVRIGFEAYLPKKLLSRIHNSPLFLNYGFFKRDGKPFVIQMYNIFDEIISWRNDTDSDSFNIDLSTSDLDNSDEENHEENEEDENHNDNEEDNHEEDSDDENHEEDSDDENHGEDSDDDDNSEEENHEEDSDDDNSEEENHEENEEENDDEEDQIVFIRDEENKNEEEEENYDNIGNPFSIWETAEDEESKEEENNDSIDYIDLENPLHIDAGFGCSGEYSESDEEENRRDSDHSNEEQNDNQEHEENDDEEHEEDENEEDEESEDEEDN